MFKKIFYLFLLLKSVFCDKYFNFLPVNIGTLKNTSSNIQFRSRCSKEVNIKLYYNKDNFSIYFYKNNIISNFCIDIFLYGSINFFNKIVVPGYTKKMIKTFNYKSYDIDISDFNFNGLHIFYFNNTLKNNIKSLIYTYNLFYSKNLELYNKEFIKEKMNIIIKDTQKDESNFNKNFIKTGDIILANRLDGL